MIAPKNMSDTVDDFIAFFNLKPDQALLLHQNDQGMENKTPCCIHSAREGGNRHMQPATVQMSVHIHAV